MTFKISVVTVCLNSRATIEATLKSVAGQTYSNIEHILVDGGSTDGTLDILRANEGTKTNWTSEPDKGLYDAMNKGISRATGDWIHILNSDDIYADEGAIERIVPHLDECKTNYFRMFLGKTDGRREIYDFPYRKWKMFVSAYLPHPAMVISRQQYKEIGLYDLRYRIAADHELTMRMVMRYPGKFVPLPFVVMNEGGVSERNKLIALEETREISSKFGLPRVIASGLYLLKKRHWGM